MNAAIQLPKSDDQQAEHKAIILGEIPKAPYQRNVNTGKKTEVYPYTIEDVKRIMEYFRDNQMWIHYLIFVMSCNTARRIGDILSLKWNKIFNPATGRIRDYLELEEQKTKKLSHVKINSAVKEAVTLYLDRTECLPSDDNYSHYVFQQLSGTHAGSVMTSQGHRNALKKAAQELGIEYNIGTHSARKTFGKFSRMLHPNDPESMQLLQYILNHSSEKITSRYIGLTQEQADKYGDDMGDFFNDYITGDKTFITPDERPVISLDASDLRDLITLAYREGLDNAEKIKESSNPDPMIHTDSINTLLSMIDELKK